jgi:hypothetical protein
VAARAAEVHREAGHRDLAGVDEQRLAAPERPQLEQRPEARLALERPAPSVLGVEDDLAGRLLDRREGRVEVVVAREIALALELDGRGAHVRERGETRRDRLVEVAVLEPLHDRVGVTHARL